MSVYVVAHILIKDREASGEYQQLVPALIEKYGVRYLVRGGNIISGENECGLTQIVMLEFPSVTDEQAMLTSDEYAPVAAIRNRAAVSKTFIVEGIDTSIGVTFDQCRR
jgi:uncharacterized protein (DUF1330 family)